MRATVYEVGPRDGLQSIPEFIPSAAKFELISHLYAAGIENIEEVSFAHPKLLPQMADAEEVFTGRGAALVMNRRGYDRAVAANVEKINLVFSACNVFNKKNLGKTRSETIDEYFTFIDDVPRENIRVYISMAFGSPNSRIDHKLIRECVQVAKALGDTVVFADTVGVGNHKDVRAFAKMAYEEDVRPALHLHHKGEEERALSLIRAGLQYGIREFDSSIGGLGGCPFARGSGANLSTESLVRHLNAWGVNCGLEEKSLKSALVLARAMKPRNLHSSRSSA